MSGDEWGMKEWIDVIPIWDFPDFRVPFWVSLVYGVQYLCLILESPCLGKLPSNP